MRPQSSMWLSYHLYIKEGADPFLTRHLSPALQAGCFQETVKRFFFTRHSENGPHLRLRFFPAQPDAAARIHGCLTELVCNALSSRPPEEGTLLRAVAYDRTSMYFGETMLSVYAELLNVQTSMLALSLLAETGGWPRARLMVLAGCLVRYFQQTTGETQKRESLDLIRNAVARAGIQVPVINAALRGKLAEMIRSSVARIGERIAAEPSSHKIDRLLSRARRLGALGSFVSAHSLHLLCNKLGLSLIEEHHLLNSLDVQAEDLALQR